MRLALSDADRAFRDELREFFTTKVPAEIRERARNDELRFPEDAVTTRAPSGLKVAIHTHPA